jgi:hypothetical protein
LQRSPSQIQDEHAESVDRVVGRCSGQYLKPPDKYLKLKGFANF